MSGGGSGSEAVNMGLRWPLRVTTARCRGVLVVSAAGRLSHSTTGALSAALQLAVGHEQAGLVIDLGQVDYVSSAGLMALQAAAARLTQGHGLLVLCDVREPVRVALDLAGLTSGFAIESSRELAAARVARNGGRP